MHASRFPEIFWFLHGQDDILNFFFRILPILYENILHPFMQTVTSKNRSLIMYCQEYKKLKIDFNFLYHEKFRGYHYRMEAGLMVPFTGHPGRVFSGNVEVSVVAVRET